MAVFSGDVTARRNILEAWTIHTVGKVGGGGEESKGRDAVGVTCLPPLVAFDPP